MFAHRLKPLHRRRHRGHLSGPLVLPEVTRDLIQYLRVYGMPLMVQPVGASGDPNFAIHANTVHPSSIIVLCSPSSIAAVERVNDLTVRPSRLSRCAGS